jgi:hypothetical protein
LRSDEFSALKELQEQKSHRVIENVNILQLQKIEDSSISKTTNARELQLMQKLQKLEKETPITKKNKRISNEEDLDFSKQLRRTSKNPFGNSRRKSQG